MDTVALTHNRLFRQSQHVAFRLALALFIVAGSFVFLAKAHWNAFVPPVKADCTNCTGQWYGGNSWFMNESIRNYWPQGSGNYCGIENAIAMVNYYEDAYDNAGGVFNTPTQYTIAQQNQKNTNPNEESQWGYAILPTGNIYGGVTNIALDTGTDPRSIAYMGWNYAPNNVFFHDHLYRWDLQWEYQPPFPEQVVEATTDVARALEDYSNVVSVTINGGLHSVIVSGLWSATNPNTSFPATIQGLVYRDPQDNSRHEIEYSTWAQYGDTNGYPLWRNYYGDGYNAAGSGGNSEDPDPSVGLYHPQNTMNNNPNGPHHWWYGFTWIQQDNNYTNGQWSPDWAYVEDTTVPMTSP